MLDDVGERRHVGLFGDDDPRSPGAVQADGHAMLSGDRTELGNRCAGTASDRERKALVGEERPTQRRARLTRPDAPPPRADRPLSSAGATQLLMIACAVPKASLPIRNTAVLPVRSTPVASANTLGRPSNTNPTTPSGARHDDTDHPLCSTVDSCWSRRVGAAAQLRKPAAMSCRIPGDSCSRVVDRPLATAASTSIRLASRTREKTVSSSMDAANRWKKSVI